MQEVVLIAILGVTAIGAVAYPVLVGRERFADEDELDREIQRYRTALEADAVCPRCRQANAADARFCAECGGALHED